MLTMIVPMLSKNKPSPSTPKMHRRISARIGQYIDTRFGDKREKTASPPPIKKDGAVVEQTSAGPAPETKAVEEVKTDVAPVVSSCASASKPESRKLTRTDRSSLLPFPLHLWRTLPLPSRLR